MPINAGGDRKDLRPLDQTGETIGNHKGNYEALNIRNAQPGFRYCWARNKQGALYRKLNQKWEFVRQGDPENLGVDTTGLPDSVQTSVDSLRPFGDVVLMRQSEENQQVQLNLQNELARAAREGAEANFMTKGEDIAGRIGSRAGSAPLYHTGKHHGSFIEESD